MTGAEALPTRLNELEGPDDLLGDAPPDFNPFEGSPDIAAAVGEVQRRRNPLFAHPWVRRVAVGASVLAMSGAPAEGVAVGTAFASGETAPAPGTMVSSTTTTTIRTSEGSDSARDVASKRMVLLEDVHLRGKVHMDDCHWTKGGFTNSGRDASGKIRYFHDPIPAKLCRSDKSPTGFVKVAGGTTGRDCENPAADEGKHVPGKLIKQDVEILRRLNVKVKLRSVAAVAVRESCGTATAKASVYQKINLKSFLRKRGNGQIRTVLRLEDRAVTRATANVKCSETDTSTVTTTTTTTPPLSPPPGQPPKQNTPPTVYILNKPQHDLDTDQIRLCAMENDAEDSSLAEQWTADHGTVSAPFHPDASSPKEVCTTYTPNDVPDGQTQNDTVTITVTDSGKLSAHDSATFPVVDDGVRPF